jgi:hypothetical protein
MKKKFVVHFVVLFFLFCSLAYAQTNTLTIIGANAKIGTENNLVVLHLTNSIPLRGIQLTLSYPQALSVGNISKTTRTKDLLIQYHEPVSGQINVLIYSFSNENILPDTGSIADMTFDVFPHALPEYHPLELKDIYASGLNGQNVELEIIDGVFVIEDNATPVELINFEAHFLREEDVVTLQWSTRSETNNYGFEIQRGTGGMAFEKIGFVEGRGTTSNTHLYRFIDSNISSDLINYRLKQINFDGSSQFSETFSVTRSTPSNYKLYQNYPNPFNPTTVISYQLPQQSYVELVISNMAGQMVTRLVSEQQAEGRYQYEWDAGDMVSGVYFYRIMADQQFVQMKKLILLK